MNKLGFLAIGMTTIFLAGCGGNATPSLSALSTISMQSSSIRSIGPDSDPRAQIRNECWFSLDPAFISVTNSTTGPANLPGGFNGCVISRVGWNYLSKKVDSQSNALQYVLQTEEGFVTDIAPGQGGSVNVANYINLLSSDAYGLNGQNTAQPQYNLSGTIYNHAHGTQCLEFAMMVIFRARHGKKINFAYPKSIKDLPSATEAKVGDLIFHILTKGKKWNEHTAVVVANDPVNKNVTVVDSNYAAHEVIGEHKFTYAELTEQQFCLYSAINYIN